MSPYSVSSTVLFHHSLLLVNIWSTGWTASFNIGHNADPCWVQCDPGVLAVNLKGEGVAAYM